MDLINIHFTIDDSILKYNFFSFFHREVNSGFVKLETYVILVILFKRQNKKYNFNTNYESKYLFRMKNQSQKMQTLKTQKCYQYQI